ncbi:hypothetical protein ACNKHM_06580 [Shigella sonnei]
MPDFNVASIMEKHDQVINTWRTCTVAMQYRKSSPPGTMAAKAVIRDVGRVWGIRTDLSIVSRN